METNILIKNERFRINILFQKNYGSICNLMQRNIRLNEIDFDLV
jgi:hypothetical protein